MKPRELEVLEVDARAKTKKRRKIKIAAGLETMPITHSLSGEKRVVVVVDINQYDDKEILWGYELPLDEARKFARSVLALADEIESIASADGGPPIDD